MSDEILAYARERNVSKIVIGKPARSRWKRIVRGSVVDELVRGSGEIDIHVISGEGAPAPVRPLRVPAARARLGRLRRSPRRWSRSATGVAWAMFPYFGLANLDHGLPARGGRGGHPDVAWPTVVASVLSVLAFDFFFVPPYLVVRRLRSEYLLTFVVMLIVALVISGSPCGSGPRRRRRASASAGSRRSTA